MSDAWPFVWFDSIDSTSEEAKRRAQNGAVDPLWIAARDQTSGRGRRGRSWDSPRGSLYCTALFNWDGPLVDLTRVPFASALAAVDAIKSMVPDSDPKLKWPNDIRVNRAKLSGILVETGEANNTRWVAAGIGINIGSAPKGVGQETTSLSALRGDTLITADIALDVLAEAFVRRLNEAKIDFRTTRADWLQHADGLGEDAQVKLDGQTIRGVFEGLAEDGALILRLPDGEQRLITAGDVDLVRDVKV